jgi:hypothetical protein
MFSCRLSMQSLYLWSVSLKSKEFVLNRTSTCPTSLIVTYILIKLFVSLSHEYFVMDFYFDTSSTSSVKMSKSDLVLLTVIGIDDLITFISFDYFCINSSKYFITFCLLALDFNSFNSFKSNSRD